MVSWRGLGDIFWESGGVFGSIGVLGASGLCFGCLLERQRTSWRRLGAILGVQGGSWEGLGEPGRVHLEALRTFLNDAWPS